MADSAAAASAVPDSVPARIFVGGLSESVSGDDLKGIFSSLGTVHGVEFVRTSGRCFAYVDFAGDSEKSIAKLFSTYNGCKWKGGKLRLEKAKQHYLARLKQEWEEDAELSAAQQNDDEKKSDAPKVGNLDLKDAKIRLYFPKLRKVKPLPYKGSGKHKYSFQRVEVPSFQIHFCDCEEHCRPLEAVNENYIAALDAAAYEKEQSIINSVMNKLLEQESMNASSSQIKLDSFDVENTTPTVDDIVIGVETYETNYADQSRKCKRLKEDLPEKKRRKALPPLSVKQQNQMPDHRPVKQKAGHSALPSSSYKPLPSASEATEVQNTLGEAATGDDSSCHQNSSIAGTDMVEDRGGTQPARTESNVDLSIGALTKGTSWMQKSSWRELVGDVGNATFSISQVAPSLNSQPPKPPPIVVKEVKTTVTPNKKAYSSESISNSGHQSTSSAARPSRTASKPDTTGGDSIGKPNHGRTFPIVTVGEVCPFMRTTDSEKEWMKAKKALSGLIKKNSEGKDGATFKGKHRGR